MKPAVHSNCSACRHVTDDGQDRAQENQAFHRSRWNMKMFNKGRLPSLNNKLCYANLYPLNIDVIRLDLTSLII